MSSLRELVAEELSQPVDPRVSATAGAIANKHGAASRAVLFYGSCLRQKQLDGLMLDFYLIVSDYRAAYGKTWLAAANRLIPPNVFYFEHDGLAAKYAVLSEADFHRLTADMLVQMFNEVCLAPEPFKSLCSLLEGRFANIRVPESPSH